MRTAVSCFSLAVLAAGCCALPAQARVIYVDNMAGDDRGEGTAPAGAVGLGGPVRSIAKALRLAEAGDRIVIARSSEPYRESISLTGSKHGGGPVGPLVIEGGGAVLDGSAPVDERAWRHEMGDVFSFQPSGLGYQQLFLRGRPVLRHPTKPADVTLPDLEPLEWCLARGRIYFRVEAGRLPQDYPLACASLRTGVTLYHVRDVVIRDLVVQGFQCDGIAAADMARGIRLEGVACQANGRSGVSASGASIVELDRCRLSDNGDSQLLNQEVAVTHLRGSVLSDESAPAMTATGGRIVVDGPSLH